MDRIEFEMEPKKSDFQGAIIKRLFMSLVFRMYLVSIIAILLILNVFSYVWEGSVYENLIEGLCAVLLVALVVPFAAALGLAKSRFKSFQKEGNKLFFLDKQGYGVKADTVELYFKWARFYKIYETNKYIFMKLNRFRSLVIFKYLLSDKTVSSIEDLISNVQVPKKMLS